MTQLQTRQHLIHSMSKYDSAAKSPGSKLFQIKLWNSRRIIIIMDFNLSQIMTQPENPQRPKYSKWKFYLAVKFPSSKIL